MTRYNNHYSGETLEGIAVIDGYREGVDRVIEYMTSTHGPLIPRLTAELKWAIEEGII